MIERHSDLVRETGNFKIPPGGLLERLELHPIGPNGGRVLVPNMDASVQYRLEARLHAPDGTIVPLELESVWQSVETPEGK